MKELNEQQVRAVNGGYMGGIVISYFLENPKELVKYVFSGFFTCFRDK